MSEIEPGYYAVGSPSWCHRIAKFSPDGKRFVVVTRRGDVVRNVNQYTMLLWNTASLASEPPRSILKLDSSIYPAIDAGSISWGADGETLTFLGEGSRELRAVFQLTLKTGTLRALTHHATDITTYALNPSGTVIAYEAIPTYESLWGSDTDRRGLVVTSQYLPDLLIGQRAYAFRGRIAESQLFVQDAHGTRQIQPLPGSHFTSDPAGRNNYAMSISPNGRYVVVLEHVPRAEVPAAWYGYRDFGVEFTLSQMNHGIDESEQGESFLSRYVLISLATGQSRVLLDAPVVMDSPVLWAPDSRSVVINETLLPMHGQDDKERRIASTETTIEVNIETGRVIQVGRGCAQALGWQGEGALRCSSEEGFYATLDKARSKGGVSRAAAALLNTCQAPETMLFRRDGDRWQEGGHVAPAFVDISLQEGMNSPPKLYYARSAHETGKLLFDPNPQFRSLHLSRVAEVKWAWSPGQEITAGLYYPMDYHRGRRYPLVIQTHGWDPDEFWFFGPSSTGFAAQPIAAHGMFVLQVDDAVGLPEKFVGRAQRNEVETAVAIYQSGVAYLNRRGLIDPKKVGVIGWSHTPFYIKWALAHEPGLFAVASVTSEGEDGGYLQYISGQNSYVDAPTLYGGGPFGQHLKAWVRLSPGFNLDHVRAPLLIDVLNPRFLLGAWEWFDGLRFLGKPVEMVMLDGRGHEEHFLQRPWDRLIASGENVDWFDFWLNGREDESADKKAQYARWEHLRALQNREIKDAAVLESAGRAMPRTRGNP